MASTAVGTHAGTASLSLMSCVRESSPQESIPDIENDKNGKTFNLSCLLPFIDTM